MLPGLAAAQRGPGRPPAPGVQSTVAEPSGHPPFRPRGGPVSQRIAGNPALAMRLQALLPPGMTLFDAASGFRSEGQFIAALHVAHNLHIPFAQLKAGMAGNGQDGLGRAILELRPDADVKDAVRTAEQQARDDLQSTRPARPGGDRH